MDLLSELNAARASQGLAPFVDRPELDAIAQAWANSMATSGVLRHNPDLDWGNASWSLLQVTWPLPMSSLAISHPEGRLSENVAKGYPDAAAVVAAWMSDLPHRANVLGAYSCAGVGAAQAADGTWFWVADFGV